MLEFEVKEEYINRVIKILDKVKLKLININSWKKEIDLIDQKINAFSEMDIEVMGYSSGGRTFHIDDILSSDESRKNILESKILKAEYELKDFKLYVELLDDEYKNIIYKRYFVTTKKNISFEKIGLDLKQSRMTIKRLHDEAIKKLAHNMLESIEKQAM